MTSKVSLTRQELLFGQLYVNHVSLTDFYKRLINENLLLLVSYSGRVDARSISFYNSTSAIAGHHTPLLSL